MTQLDAYCSACGTELSSAARVCPDCGAPQRGDRGRLALFVAILSAVLGLFALGIVFGPVAAVAGYYAYRHVGGWLRYLAAAACVVGVLNALLVVVYLFAFGGI